MEPRVDLWLQNLIDEREGSALYDGLAQLEKDPERAESFQSLADGERRHADIWARKLQKEGVDLPPDRPSPRVRLLLWMARRLGTPAVLPFIVAAEAGDADKYAKQGGEGAKLAEEEEEHRAVLIEMRGDGPTNARAIIANRERWHRAGRAGSIRAAVFGMNDGLVSNIALVFGVAAAGAQPSAVLVTGFAGLFAGACSMAVGEYVSVASERDMLARQIALEARELAEAPEEEAAELALLYKQKGLSTEQATQTARELLKNPETALDTLVREELGLDPADLGSPIRAAVSSLASFAVGAFLPILPFLLTQGRPAVIASAVLCGGVLLTVGGVLGFLTGNGPVKPALRMFGLALAAVSITVIAGKLVGGSLQ